MNRNPLCFVVTAVTACTSSPPPSDAQLPPTIGADIESWLAARLYDSWACEPAVHAARMPSPHGFNRICSNDAIANAARASGPWPVGAASVKELYNSASDPAPVGFAVYRKLADDSADGANWYWYERAPQDGVVADGTGESGNAKTICVGCHAGAGIDAMHTPSPGGRDFVYTPVL